MGMSRRESLKLMAVASLASAIPGCTPEDVEKASSRVAAAAEDPLSNRSATVLGEHEYRTLRILVDYIIPADARSGRASDAGVPAFIDFMLEDSDDLETPLRGGLAWLDYYCSRKYGATFLDADSSEQIEVLDAIAYPDDSDEDVRPGVGFFSLLRDLTASGFWSSRIGVQDLGYSGNMALASWEGCPESALNHLGLVHDET